MQEAVNVISIDIESTGLDLEKDSVLEIGARVWRWGDFDSEIESMPSYSRIIRYDRVSGSPRALEMNAGILRHIADRPEDCLWPGKAAEEFAAFVEEHMTLDVESQRMMRPVALGKNAAGFDIPMIAKLGRGCEGLFKSRVLDPAALWLQPGDIDGPPGLAECARRAGIEIDEVDHRALSDADLTLRVFIAGLKRLWR